MSGNDGKCSREEQSLAPWERGEHPLFLGRAGWMSSGTDTGRRRGQREAACLPWAGSMQGLGVPAALLPAPTCPLADPSWRRLSRCCTGHVAATSGAVPDLRAQSPPRAAALRKESVRSQESLSIPCQRLIGPETVGVRLYSNAGQQFVLPIVRTPKATQIIQVTPNYVSARICESLI